MHNFLTLFLRRETSIIFFVKRISIFFVLCIGLGCGTDAALLVGEWQAAAFFEEGQSVPAPLDSTQLVFYPNGTYQYRTLGQYREAGRYTTDLKYLFLRDTNQAETPKTERTLRVLFVSKDSLKLLMSAAGKDQVVFWKRK